MRCRCLWLSCRLPCNATLVVLPIMAMQQQPLESQARSFEQVPSPKVPADDAGGAAQPASPSGDGDSDVAAFLTPNTGAASSLDAAPAPVSADELSKLGLELDPEPMSHAGDIDAEDSGILEDLTQLSLNSKLECIKPYGGADQPARKPKAPPPVKPKAPPPTINCVVCGRACGYPHRAPIWSKDETPVPTCGGICLLTWYDSNTPWPADLVWLEHSPHVDSDSDALQPASAERPVDHSTQSSAGRPASLSSDVESTMPKAAQSFLLPTNAELTRAEIDCLGPQKPSPARYPQARAPPEDLDRRMRKRYHPPGCPSNTCTSLQLGGTTWAGAPRHNNSGSAERPASSDQQVSINTPKQNSSGSAEQFAPSRAAVSSVPVHSPDRNTGFRHSQFNPQSGDLVPCQHLLPPWVAGRAKPPPPALPPNSLLPLQWMNGARDTVHNVTSFANGHLAPPESSDPRRNSQEPTFPPAAPFKAPPPLGPRRVVLFRQFTD